MRYYLFVEGFDDKHFFETLYSSSLPDAKCVEYSNMSHSKVNKFLQAIKGMDNVDYLFFCDEDKKGIEAKRATVLNRYKNLESEKLYVVQCEIESWYYAGISELDCKKLRLNHFEYNTDQLCKEKFNSKLRKGSDRKYVMDQMLAVFNEDLARNRNFTFSKFCQIKEKIGDLNWNNGCLYEGDNSKDNEV